MLSFSVICLILAVIAAVFGFTGLMGTATYVVWMLFGVCFLVFVAGVVLGPRESVP